jgi:hypothetical protein
MEIFIYVFYDTASTNCAMTLGIVTLSITTIDIMTLSITTIDIMTLSITTIDIMTLRITIKNMTISNRTLSP